MLHISSKLNVRTFETVRQHGSSDRLCKLQVIPSGEDVEVTPGHPTELLVKIPSSRIPVPHLVVRNSEQGADEYYPERPRAPATKAVRRRSGATTPPHVFLLVHRVSFVLFKYFYRLRTILARNRLTIFK